MMFIGPNIGFGPINNININNIIIGGGMPIAPGGCCGPQIPPHILIQLIMILISLLQAQQCNCYRPPIFQPPFQPGPIMPDPGIIPPPRFQPGPIIPDPGIIPPPNPRPRPIIPPPDVGINPPPSPYPKLPPIIPDPLPRPPKPCPPRNPLPITPEPCPPKPCPCPPIIIIIIPMPCSSKKPLSTTPIPKPFPSERIYEIQGNDRRFAQDFRVAQVPAERMGRIFGTV